MCSKNASRTTLVYSDKICQTISGAIFVNVTLIFKDNVALQDVPC